MISESRLVAWLATAVAVWVVYLLSPMLTPFVAAALLAYLGDPLVDRLQRVGLGRTLAVVVVFLVIFVGIGLLTVLVLPLARAQAAALLQQLPGYVDLVESRVLPRLTRWLGVAEGESGIGVAALLERFGQQLPSIARGAVGTVSRSGTAVLALIGNMFLIPVITFYMLRDWDVLMARLAAFIPDEHRDRIVGLARDTDDALGAFMRGQLLVVLALSLIYSVGLWLMQLKYALAIGVVAGLVSFVPYLGLVVGIGLAGLAALAQLQSAWALLGVVAVFVVGQLVESTVLTPKLVGERIGLHPVLVIFAVLAGGQLFGFFGALLGLPGAAVLSVLARFAYAHYLEWRGDGPDGGDDGEDEDGTGARAAPADPTA